MILQGYKCNDIDHFLYSKCSKDGSLLILILYVEDDMLIFRSNIDEIATLQSKLNATFDMKDLGDEIHILGMCLVWNRQ